MEVAPRLRGYIVEGLLGRGASGEVWQARIDGTSTRVALKRIRAPGAEQLRKAHDEAALLAALDHENLVRLHALVPADDAMVLVLDLAERGSLADLLAGRGRLTPGEVITALAPVAAAVEYLHDAGVVHGDISPANILFSAAGVPMLADVGVARLTGDDADAAAPPAHVDPAVAAGCVPGPQSDVFMLGAVALHALTGTPPWPDPEPEAALARAARGVLGDVRERLGDADVPDAMAAVVCRALTVEPQRRGTAADFALDLRHGGRPLAVELAAGRTRPVLDRSGPRHAAWRNPQRRDDLARPPFERPDVAGVQHNASSAPPTRMVAARPRPVIPRPAPRRRLRTPFLVIAAVLVAAAAAASFWLHSGPTARVLSTPRAEVETSSAHASPSATPTSDDRKRSPAGWLAWLDELDALRARAYATRDVSLLRQVYAPGPLLRSDAALLVRLVPPGCGLVGARTRYASGTAHSTARRLHISVRAALRPSELTCAGRVRGHAVGRGPTTLVIELVRTPAGLRIVAQRVRPARAPARTRRLPTAP